MKKRVALITGVSGGIGSAAARVFSEAGWHVVGVDLPRTHQPASLDRFIGTDIAEPETNRAIFQTLEETEKRLDVLINNAAVQICKPLLEMELEEWDQVMACNLRSVFLTVRYAHRLLKRSQGAIVNVSSVHALATSKNIAAYATSKGALLALTRAMALEFETEIRVNAVLPGAVDTPMLRAGLQRCHLPGGNLEEQMAALGQKHPLKRIGLPEEIAQAILFLADSKRSSFMTGQMIVVDGGATGKLSTE
jgi:NAD(P)-dependent dehydrogenase (short-subunit alcohol dehydrogenase family)